MYLKKIKIMFYIIFFFKFNIFFFKKKIILNKIYYNINKLWQCINCHSINNKIIYPEIYTVPNIKYQKFFYIKSSLIDYKKFFKKSLYMNNICKTLSYLDIIDISKFFVK